MVKVRFEAEQTEKPSKRGRPRSENTEDTTRRKIQVREAQRAYRARQTSALATSQARVEHLENVIRRLGGFVEGLAGQVSPYLIPDSPVEGAVMEFVERCRGEIRGADLPEKEKEEDQGEGEGATPNESTESESLSQAQSPVTQLIPSHPKPSPTSTSTSSQITLPLHSPPTSTSSFFQLFQSSSNALLPQYNPPSTNTSSSSSPPPSPFMKKLYHACVQSGHAYITNPSTPDEGVFHAFGLLLQTIPREDVANYFSQMLSSESKLPIRDARFPFFSLGGAGTHYQTIMAGRLERGYPAFLTTNGVRVVEGEEDWFDVTDVEGFLMEQGIVLLDGSGGRVIGGNGVVLGVDENVLINELSHYCICLGCSPGFRRRVVERVVWEHAKLI